MLRLRAIYLNFQAYICWSLNEDNNTCPHSSCDDEMRTPWHLGAPPLLVPFPISLSLFVFLFLCKNHLSPIRGCPRLAFP